MGNVLDRFVGFFNPMAGLRRHHAREVLARAYEGASQRDGWRPRRSGASANTDHAADATTLRARSRALTQNVPYIAQGLRSLVANVVGTGITPNWTGPNAEKFNKAWAKWVRECDADGRFDYYGLQAAAYRAMEQDGEVLVRLRQRRSSDGLTVPLQLQLLEIDWLDSSRLGRALNPNNVVVNGIEYDPLGRVAGYWLFSQHPGEINTLLPRRASSFVSAENIIHLYTPDRPGQGRGFPRIAPVVARVRDLQLYEDAELTRKNLETRLSVLVSGDIQQLGAPPGGDVGDITDPKSLGTLASGALTQIPMGMTTTVVNPQVVPGYVEYVKHQLHLIAAGFGVTYEMMTGDVKEVNFSSARVRMLDFRREAEVTQWTVLIPKLCGPICNAFANACELQGLVPAANYDIDHATPKWDYVNPQQDVAADIAEIGGGLSSISEKLRRRGYKPQAVFAELAEDIKKLRELGLLDVMLLMQKGKVTGQDDAANDAKPPAPAPAPAASRAEEPDLLRQLLRQQEKFEGLMADIDEA